MTQDQHASPASANRAEDQPLDPFHCFGEASSITTRQDAGRRGQLINRPGRCIDKLPDGLADDPRDGSIAGQCDLIERPIVLFFQAHGQPRCLPRTLVHATPHDSIPNLSPMLIRLQRSDALFTSSNIHDERLERRPFEIDMGLASRRCCRRRRAFSPWIEGRDNIFGGNLRLLSAGNPSDSYASPPQSPKRSTQPFPWPETIGFHRHRTPIKETPSWPR